MNFDHVLFVTTVEVSSKASRTKVSYPRSYCQKAELSENGAYQKDPSHPRQLKWKQILIALLGNRAAPSTYATGNMSTEGSDTGSSASLNKKSLYADDTKSVLTNLSHAAALLASLINCFQHVDDFKSETTKKYSTNEATMNNIPNEVVVHFGNDVIGTDTFFVFFLLQSRATLPTFFKY